MTVVRILRAGAIFTNSPAIMEDIEHSTVQENSKWRHWNSQKQRLGYPKYAQPARWIYCSGSVDAFVPDLFKLFGRSKGLVWAAPHAPGTVKMKHESISYRPSAGAIKLSELQCEMRPYQKQALQSAAGGKSGLIVAPCGSGKTTIGVALGATIDTNVLILVPSLDLAKQWYDRIRQLAPEQDVHIRTSRNPLCKRWTIATLQSMDRLKWDERWEIGKRHGLVIVDECHRIAARTFSAVMASLPSAQRIGLSATPTRADGLTAWIHQMLGSTLHQIHPEELSGTVLLEPEVHQVRYKSDLTNEQGHCYTRLINKVLKDDRRNSLICELVKADRSVLVLSDRIEHCHKLAEQIDGAEVFVGSMSKKNRTDLIERARTGALRVICATTVADEGLDIPRLDTVILASPSKNLERITQRIGRILRPHPDKKKPRVYDIVDSFGPFQGYAKKRANLYKKRGWRIVRK